MSNEDKVVPHNLELEEAVLGAILIERSAFGLVSQIIDNTSFYDTKLKCIYEAVETLVERSEPIDIITVKNELESTKRLDCVGGAFKIAELTSKMVSSAHIERHARILKDLKTRRDLILLSTKLLNSSYDNGVDILEILDMSEQSIMELSRSNTSTSFKHINEIIPEVYEEIKVSASNDSSVSGIPSGFHALDAYTSGFQSPDLIIIAARPAMGKTAFALTVAHNIAEQENKGVGIFSLEMGDNQLVKRLFSTASSVNGNKLKTGRLHAEEWLALDQGLNRLIDKPIYIDDTPGLSIVDFKAKARKMVKDYGVKIIIVDYIQLMTANKNNRQEEVSYISRSLKGVAKELDIPIIALSQLNRGVEGRDGVEGKRPQLSDLRESGAIEQDADIVSFLYRPEYYNIKQDENGNSTKGIAEVIIAKHRSGECGTAKLRFRGECTRFENIDDYSDSFESIQEPPPF